MGVCLADLGPYPTGPSWEGALWVVLLSAATLFFVFHYALALR